MRVRELIAALAAEKDMDSSLFARIVDKDGKVEFVAVEGIAVSDDSYKPFNALYSTCTTLLLDV